MDALKFILMEYFLTNQEMPGLIISISPNDDKAK